jgi:hypothetical protein
MKVTRLFVKHVKGVKEFEVINPPAFLKLSGKNGAGKSTVLESINYAVGGKGVIDDIPLRSGEETGQIILETEDLVICRNFSADGKTSLKVKGKEGGSFIQRDLDAMFSTLCIDPLEFTRMTPAKQIEIIRGYLPGEVIEDLKKMDERIKGLEEDRVFKHRVLQDMPDHQELPEKVDPVNTSDLANRLVEIQGNIRAVESLEGAVNRDGHGVIDVQRRIDQLELQLVGLKTELDSKQAAKDSREKELEKARKLPMDTSEIQEKLDSAEEVNLMAADYDGKAADMVRREMVQGEYDGLTNMIGEARTQRIATIEASSEFMPVKGLVIKDGALWVGDTPFKQLSSGEKLSVSTRIAVNTDPRLKIILVKSGECLDAGNLNTLKEIAAEKDFQLWVEQINTDEDSLVMEDGTLVDNKAPRFERER